MLFNVSRSIVCRHLLRNNRKSLVVSVCTRQLRNGSKASNNSADIDDSHTTVLSKDGSMIVSWHPEQDFPYECSKPIPIFEESIKEGDSVLKLQYRVEDSKRFVGKKPQWQEMTKLTYTNKHIWYPPANKKYRFPPSPPDREGL